MRLFHESNLKSESDPQLSMTSPIHRLRLLGNGLYRNAEYQQALQCYNQALAITGSEEDTDMLIYTLRLNCAATNLKLSRFHEALNDADKALVIQSTSIKGLYRKASALVGLSRNNEAVAVIQQALGLDPANHELHALLDKINISPTIKTEEELLRHALPSLYQNNFSYVPCSTYTSSSEQSINNQITPLNIILAFHGLGDAPSSFKGLFQQMQLPNTSILIIGGPYPVPGAPGGTYFKVFEDDYELISGKSGERRRIDSMKKPLALLKDIIHRLRPHYDGIHLFGYQHGGTFAVELAIQCVLDGIQLESCISISAGLLSEHQYHHCVSDVTTTTSTRKSIPKILITVGALDTDMIADLTSQKLKIKDNYGVDDIDVACIPEKAATSGGIISGPNEAKVIMTFWSRVLIQMSTEGLIDVTNPSIMITKEKPSSKLD